MPRPASIWLRDQDGFFHTAFQGRKVKLSQDKAEAERAFHAPHAQAPEPDKTAAFRPSFREPADVFLAHARQTKERTTYDLQSFCDHVKKRLACDLKLPTGPPGCRSRTATGSRSGNGGARRCPTARTSRRR